MLVINNNQKFVDFASNDFWVDVDKEILTAFAENIMHSSFTAFKVRFDILIETKSNKAQEIYKQFVEFCSSNNYSLPNQFNIKAQELLKNVKEQTQDVEQKKENIAELPKNKFSLTKWKNRARRKHVREDVREL